MKVIVKASDLKFKYRKDTENRDQPKFSGKPDPAPFNRDDIYEILPMFSAIMSTLETNDDRVLHLLEEIMIYEMPHCVTTREEVYDCLLESVRNTLS